MTTTTGDEYTITVNKDGVQLLWQGQTFEVDSVDLEEGGWEHTPTCDENHCDAGDCAPCERSHVEDIPGDPTEALKRWHDEESGHAGPFVYCYEAPCKPVRDALEDWG